MNTSTEAHQALLKKFYTAFANSDAETMVSCYHKDVEFKDPAFGTLNGDRAKNMWRLLVERGKGAVEVTFRDIEATETGGKAHWEAIYLFAKTGKSVHNVIDATFEFKDGLIVKHHDNFDFWKWCSMALGFVGKLMGWTDMMERKVQGQSNAMLDKYIERRNA